VEAEATPAEAPNKSIKARAAELLERVGPVAPLLKKHWKLAAAAVAGVGFLGMVFLVVLLMLVFGGSKPGATVAQSGTPTPSTSPVGEPVIALPTITNSIGMKFVLIPAGSFTMGSPNAEAGRSSSEGPQSKITIKKPFYLATHLVTVKHFREFVKSSGHTTYAEVHKNGKRWNPTRERVEDDASFSWQNPGWPLEDDQPVVGVIHDDAEAFCRWLNFKDDKRYRLPYEAEWEYACRANTATPFSCGTTLSSSQANFNGDFPYSGGAKGPNLGKVAKVGSYPPNPFGLYDVHGNVWQWCVDLYLDDYYEIRSSTSDPHGPPGGNEHVLRGGAWSDQALSCRSACRNKGRLDYSDNRTGFRVVMIASDK
jgi:formylglycine-generating enzyme required for sulfatase activity